MLSAAAGGLYSPSVLAAAAAAAAANSAAVATANANATSSASTSPPGQQAPYTSSAAPTVTQTTAATGLPGNVSPPIVAGLKQHEESR